ncbi:hypothetical protein Tco_0727324, partial [Tanacetum coccineum]
MHALISFAHAHEAGLNTKVVAQWSALLCDAHYESACLYAWMYGLLELHRQFELHYRMKDSGALICLRKQAGVRNERDMWEQLGTSWLYATTGFSVGLILNGLTKDFVGFVRNYNMHNMGKTIGEISCYALLEYERIYLKMAGNTSKERKLVGSDKFFGYGAIYDDLNISAFFPFGIYALEYANEILIWFQLRGLKNNHYECGLDKFPNLSYLRSGDVTALVKRDTPDKLEQKIVKLYLIGYPRKTMGYYLNFPPGKQNCCCNGAVGLEELQGKSTTAMSATESEYLSCVRSCMGSCWIRKFISGLGLVDEDEERMDDEDMNMEDEEVPQKRHHLLLLTEEEEEEKDEIKRQKLTPFSDLNDHQLKELFGEALWFELCSVFLIYDSTLEDHKLFGTIRVAATANGFSPDPLNAFSDIFNREFNNPVEVTCIGYQYLYDMHYCSLPVSSTSTVQIAAKLYVTTDEVDDVDKYPEDHHQIEVQNHGEVVDVDEDFERLCELWDSYDD